MPEINRDGRLRREAADLATRQPYEGDVLAFAEAWRRFLAGEDVQHPLAPTEPQPPAHGLAVGDVIGTKERLADAPVGTVVLDRDKDVHTLHEDGWAFRNYEQHYPITSASNVIRNYLPATIKALPEPPVIAPEPVETHPARERGSWMPSDTHPDEPTPSPREYLERVVGEALGAASTAWTSEPRGVFESSYVAGIVDTLMAAIDRYADGDVPHVEIGGQRMTEAQYNAVRESIVGTPGEASPPAASTRVGDVIDLADEDSVQRWMNALPAGAVIRDRDGDVYAKDGSGWSNSAEFLQGYQPLEVIAVSPLAGDESVGD